MSKKRNRENQGLPKNWRFKHNAFFYRVPPAEKERWDGKTEFLLGKTLAEAYAEYSKRITFSSDLRTIGDLLDRYAAQVVPQKAIKSQKSNVHSIKYLKKVFSKVLIKSLKPSDVFQYMDIRSQQGKKNASANRDLEVLSHAYTCAIRWGACEIHPTKGKVQKLPTTPVKRYVTDQEVLEVLKVADSFMSAYIKLKLMTGLRKSDLLTIRLQDIKDYGLHVRPSKTAHTTGKEIIFEWNDQLRVLVELIVALPKRRRTDYLFETRGGKPYINHEKATNSFDSRWQRFMKKALIETNLQESFREHDLRAKPASDSDLVHAQHLLGHASPEMTKRAYRRKADVVAPMSYDFIDIE
jgi:integrase